MLLQGMIWDEIPRVGLHDLAGADEIQFGAVPLRRCAGGEETFGQHIAGNQVKTPKPSQRK